MPSTTLLVCAVLAIVCALGADTGTDTGAPARPTIAVVGGGLAGLSASLEAVTRGARVILFDKAKSVGGNSAKATSGINGAPTHRQAALDVSDTVADHYHDTMVAGRGLCDAGLVRTLCADSAAAISFLEQQGIELAEVFQLGGHGARRTHREAPLEGRPRPVGWDIVTTLRKKLETLPADSFEVRTSTHVTGLGRAPGSQRVTRVLHVPAGAATGTEPTELAVDAVILTTGGYGFNGETNAVLAAYAPKLSFLPTTNGNTATGDGVLLGQALGAATVLMEYVQVHPTGFVDPKDPAATTKFLAPEALRGSGGILLNRRGERFVDELAARDTVTGAIYRFSPVDDAAPAPESTLALHDTPAVRSEAFLVLTDEAVKMFGPAAFGFYHKAKGFFSAHSGPAALAAAMTRALAPTDADADADVSPFVVAATLDAYAAAANGTRPDAFGKRVFPAEFQGAAGANATLYVARITPAIHYTMGGLAIDRHARVLADDTVEGSCAVPGDRRCGPAPIPGLFAAGEVAGGVHGANRLGGNSLLECVVFGRIAAQTALADLAAGDHGIWQR